AGIADSPYACCLYPGVLALQSVLALIWKTREEVEEMIRFTMLPSEFCNQELKSELMLFGVCSFCGIGTELFRISTTGTRNAK
ncbi:hypothetical protein Nmel_010694, partial [Mimus melanotis]